jgi:glycosyltransferase involved in cell wall biosynthesis
MTAAFRPSKGHRCLVEATRLLARRGIHFELTFAGDLNSDTGELIKHEVIRRGLADFVHFPGQVTDMASLLREHDVFVLPSESEGLPLSLLEAMACGLAVVATRVGGIPEIVLDGKTGLLVEPAKPSELAHRLQALIASSELRHSLGAAGATLVGQHFSFTQCAERIVEAYIGAGRWKVEVAHAR